MINFKPDSNEKYLQDMQNYLLSKKWKVNSYKTQRNISWLSPNKKLAILHHYFLKHPNVNRNYNKFDLLYVPISQ